MNGAARRQVNTTPRFPQHLLKNHSAEQPRIEELLNDWEHDTIFLLEIDLNGTLARIDKLTHQTEKVIWFLYSNELT